VLGLDFGTSTTLLAAEDGLIWLGDTNPWLPSLVGFDDDGYVVVGEAADNGGAARLIRSVKRAITRRRATVPVESAFGAYEVNADELIVALLRSVVRRAEFAGADLAEPGSVWFGCPAVWDGGQRERFVSLAQRAGLPASVTTVVDEPVAAGVSWLHRHPDSDELRRLLVFDMGGGTLDLAIVDVHGGTDGDVEILAAVGRTEAGDRLDEAIADDLARDLAVADARVGQQRELLLDAARRLKIRLTREVEDVVVLPRDLFGARNEAWYTRADLEAAFAAQLDRATESILVALRIAALAAPSTSRPEPSPAELLATVDAVLLSGGMSRVPYVSQRLRTLFGDAVPIQFATEPPEAAVAFGLTNAWRHRRGHRYALPYDIRLEWDAGLRSHVLYQAYTPIVESWWIESGAPRELKFLATGRGLALPERATGVLRVRADDAGSISASLGRASLDGHPVALNGDGFALSIYPDGRLQLVDGAGVHHGHTSA
jgi:molecular chaperone DnaK (HSP70)